MTKKEKTENAIAIPVQNARMANVYTEANAAKSMLSTNSKIALLEELHWQNKAIPQKQNK